MNAFIDGKRFFELPMKNEKQPYKKFIDMSNNNDYTTGDWLDFVYFKKKN